MPSVDTSLQYALMQAGMAAGNALDISNKVTTAASAAGAVAAITSGTITGVTLNNTAIGGTTASTGKFTSLTSNTKTDISGTPGSGTSSGMVGRAAFAAAGSSVVVTNTLTTANSAVFVSLRSGDATLTTVTVTPGSGSFTVTGNAAATATVIFDFLVLN